MSDISFTCVMNAEQIAAQKKYDRIVGAIVLPLCLVLIAGAMGILIYAMTLAWAEKDYFLLVFGGFFVLLILCCCIYLGSFIIQNRRMCAKAYDIMESKSLTYSSDKHVFTYKDKYRTITFKGRDVQKWVSVVARVRYSESTNKVNIILLRNGEQMVFEDKFNPDVHNFLHVHKISIGLPDPKPMTTVVNYYDNPI